MSFFLVIVHLAISIGLFFLVNWLGKKSVDVGYVEFSHFTDKLESPLFNIVFRIVAPLVYLIIIAAILYGANLDKYVTNIYFIIVYYFLFRWLIILLLNRRQLTSWWRQFVIGAVTIILAYVLYIKVIAEKENIMPDPGELANELWIIIILFVYGVVNKLKFGTEAIFNRRNNYIENQYQKFHKDFSPIIDRLIYNEKLKCLIYSIMIYEDFNRPKIVRIIENISFRLSNKRHSLGIMQFQTNTFITDKQSVQLASQKILAKYENLKRTLPLDQQDEWTLKRSIITDYNSGDKYLFQVNSIEEILALLKFNNPSFTL